jgi:hypothetical protein
MNLTIVFVFVCMFALIITAMMNKKLSAPRGPPQYRFAFAQRAPVQGGARGGRQVRGRGGARAPRRGGRRVRGSPPKAGGSNTSSGPTDACGLAVTTMDQLDTIFNTIGFKFSGNSDRGPVPQKSHPLPGPLKIVSQKAQPPMPGSNNNNLDAILKGIMAQRTPVSNL